MIPLLREAVAAARSQAVASLLTIAMVAGMCTAALLTTGRTVAAEQAALAQLDAAGTRSLIVRASADAGLTSSLLTDLSAVESIESVAGFGPIVDARNAAVGGAAPVALRPAYGTIGARAMRDHQHPTGPAVLASDAATTAFGLHDGTGGVVTDHGEHLTVTDHLEVPGHLRFLEPLAVVPADATDDRPLAMLVVLTRTPPEVAAVEALLRAMLADILQGSTPGEVSIETSAELAAIRAAVSGELGTHARGTVLGILALSAVLVAVNLLALVTMRRKDFGRRRALGATRALITALLLAQTGLLAGLGATAGTAGSLAVLAATGSPLPGVAFTLAVTVAAVLAATAAALLPALIAARRDPLHELRVP
jgi:putative ABC transport system permease protein